MRNFSHKNHPKLAIFQQTQIRIRHQPNLPHPSEQRPDPLPDRKELNDVVFMAKRDKARIISTGSYALNALGLSTQVPMKIVYLTDAAPRKMKIGKATVLFKRTTAKKLSYKSELYMPAVQALREMGQGLCFRISTHIPPIVCGRGHPVKNLHPDANLSTLVRCCRTDRIGESTV